MAYSWIADSGRLHAHGNCQFLYCQFFVSHNLLCLFMKTANGTVAHMYQLHSSCFLFKLFCHSCLMQFFPNFASNMIQKKWRGQGEKPARPRRQAKVQPCFSHTGVEDRIERQFRIWQSACKLPQSEDSWLVCLGNGNFQCKACAFVDNDKLCGLGSDSGLEATRWTRLQT